MDVEYVNDYALMLKWNGSGSNEKPLAFLAHYDVVPIESGSEDLWRKDPFGGELEGDSIYGRGALDDKNAMITILEAATSLLKEGYQPGRDVYLLFGFDEEIEGHNGAQAIAQVLEDRGISFDFILDEGGAIVDNVFPGIRQPIGVIGVAEKGIANLTLSASDEGGHSSQPKKITAIGRVSRAITYLEEEQLTAKLKGPALTMLKVLRPHMSGLMRYVFSNLWLFKPLVKNILLKSPTTAALIRTSIAPTIFIAGEKENMLPQAATANVNLRVSPYDKLSKLEKQVKSIIDDKQVSVSISGHQASRISSTKSFGYKAIVQAAKNTYPKALFTPYLMLGASDSRHYEKLCPNIYRFSPVHITSEELASIHGNNESISIENLKNGVLFYQELLRLAGGGSLDINSVEPEVGASEQMDEIEAMRISQSIMNRLEEEKEQLGVDSEDTQELDVILEEEPENNEVQPESEPEAVLIESEPVESEPIAAEDFMEEEELPVFPLAETMKLPEFNDLVEEVEEAAEEAETVVEETPIIVEQPVLEAAPEEPVSEAEPVDEVEPVVEIEPVVEVEPVIEAVSPPKKPGKKAAGKKPAKKAAAPEAAAEETPQPKPRKATKKEESLLSEADSSNLLKQVEWLDEMIQEPVPEVVAKVEEPPVEAKLTAQEIREKEEAALQILPDGKATKESMQALMENLKKKQTTKKKKKK